MKVDIKNYVTHRFYHNWLYNLFGYEPEQSVAVCIEPWDTYSMDSTLAYIILPMLKQLKVTKHGMPIVDDEDVPHMPHYGSSSNESAQYDLFASDEQDALFWNQYEPRWDYVLDEMIFAFESKHNDWEEQFHSGEVDRVVKDLENGYTEWLAGPNHTFKIDMEGCKAYRKRISNGYRLFARYYDSLWS